MASITLSKRGMRTLIEKAMDDIWKEYTIGQEKYIIWSDEEDTLIFEYIGNKGWDTFNVYWVPGTDCSSSSCYLGKLTMYHNFTWRRMQWNMFYTRLEIRRAYFRVRFEHESLDEWYSEILREDDVELLRESEPFEEPWFAIFGERDIEAEYWCNTKDETDFWWLFGD